MKRQYPFHLVSLLQKTWAPRGAETAQTLYNITSGWVTHDEVRFHPLAPMMIFQLECR